MGFQCKNAKLNTIKTPTNNRIIFSGGAAVIRKYFALLLQTLKLPLQKRRA